MAQTKRRRTALYVSCPFLVFVLVFLEILPSVCLLSGFCPYFLSGFCLSRFCPLSGFGPEFCKRLSDVYLSGFFLSRFCPDCLSSRTKTRQRCPDFQCSCPPMSGPSDVTLTLIISRICYRSSTDDCKNIWTCFGLFG